MRAIGIGQCSWDNLALLESFPDRDTKAELFDWTEQGGGPVATALVALRRLGASTAFFGVHGDDREGELTAQSLHIEGVDIDGLLARENSRSQIAFIAVEKTSASRTIFWQRPTGEALKPEELPDDFLVGADVLLLDGLMKDVSLHSAKLARDAGVPVVVDAGRTRDGMLELCSLSGHVVGSEEFAHDLGVDFSDDRGFCEIASSVTDGIFTITLGHRGSVTCHRGEVIRTEVFETRAVDTTGAGDVFHAGYAYGIISGWPIEQTLVFASACASLSIRALGGRTALPSLEAVMELISK